MTTDRIPSEFEDALGAEIAAALDDYRVDAEDFTEDVVTAIQDRTEQAATSPLPGFVRVAAGLLPPVLLPLSLAQKTAAATAVASKASSVKVLPGVFAWLAMPAAIAVMLVMTFVVAVQRIRFGNDQRDDNRAAQKATFAWWKRNGFTVAVVGAGLYALLLFDYVLAIYLFCALSMVFLMATIGSLARAGFATRREVAGRSAGLLFMTAPAMMVGGSMLLRDGLAQHSGHFSAIAMLVAATICSMLSAPSGSRRRWIGIVWAAVVLVMILPFVIMLGKLSRTQADTESARHWIETYELPYERVIALSSWDEAAKTIRQLHATGHAVDLASLASSLHRHIDTEVEAGEELNPLFYVDLGLLGLLRPEDLDRMRTAYFDERTLNSEQPIISIRHDVLQIVRLQNAGQLTATERATLASRISAGRLPAEIQLNLSDLLTRTLVLEFLGHDELIARLTPDVQAALRANWTWTPGATMASFVNSANLFEQTDDAGETWGKERWQETWREASSDAVELMAYHGVPSDLDLRWLRRNLEKHAWQHDHAIGQGALAATTSAHLDLIADTFPTPTEDWIRWFLSYRIFWAAVLLSVFCVVITLRAPVHARSPGAPA